MMSKLRIVFMGSALLSCKSLAALLAPDSPVEVVAVVSQPDRPRGRNLALAASPVKTLATQAGLPALTPEDVNADDSLEALRRFAPDAIVVVAFGQMLRSVLLALPSRGCINLHASLLPRYRGAAPIQWAIANGDRVTGVTTMFMVRRMDAGDLILQREVPIRPEDTAGTLHDRLADEGALLLAETLIRLSHGTASSSPQDERQVTFAPKIRKEDGKVDWTLPAHVIHNRMRGFDPWPGSYCMRGDEEGGVPFRIKILRARVEETVGAVGRVLDLSGDGPLVGTGSGALRLLEVQPEGKKPMDGAAYANGCRMRIGDRF